VNRQAEWRLGLVLAAALLPAWTVTGLSAALPDIDVRTRVSADSVTVGERIRVVYEMTFPDSLSLVPPEGFETGTCRLLSVTWKEKKSVGEVTKTAELEAMTTDLERAYIPPVTFRFVTPAGDTLASSSGEVEVGVRRLAQDDGKPKPLKPQWEAPRSWTFLLWIACGLALAALAFWFVRRWRKRAAVKAPEPVLPADFVALRRLEEIERMGLLESGDFKKYYTLVVDVLRVYLEKRYGIVAMDQTTDEILWALRRVEVDAAEVEPLLREADLVKFAKHQPEVPIAKGLVEGVRKFVARTAERPLEAARSA
jgi:hypothetical protein